MTQPQRSSAQPSGAALRLEVLEGSIALATLDQPNSRANTLGQAILGEFETLVADLAKRTDLTGLVLRSAKPGIFIAGADLRELGSGQLNAGLARTITQRGLN